MWLAEHIFTRLGTRLINSPSFPSAVSKNFSLVDTWSTDLRYKSGTTKRGDAESFLRAAREIMDWANGRFAFMTWTDL